MSRLILVAIDGSEHSKKALLLACELASKLDGRLHLIHVAQTPHQNKTLVLGAASVTVHASREELEKVGHKVLDAAKQLMAKTECDRFETEVLTGNPAKAIIKAATDKKADMIVMGSRGLSDFEGLMLGSVSHKVNQFAPCTCVFVK
jgi:nucleotide-binding universal stress UspA family protein